MDSSRIALCGSGHGAFEAFHSLKEKFDKIFIFSEDDELLKLMRASDIKLNALDDLYDFVIVCAGFTDRVSDEVLYRNTVINTHPSLLPAYRGMHSLVWAMLNDEPKVGFSIHLMNGDMDDGDILAQFEMPNVGQTSAEFWNEFDRYVRNQLACVVLDFINGHLQPKPQDIRKATWVPKRNLKDCEMNWADTNNRLNALIRALVPPYPYPLIRTPKNIYSVVDAAVINKDYYCTVGRVVGHHDGAALIKSAEGLVCIKGLEDPTTGAVVSVAKALPVGLRLPTG